MIAHPHLPDGNRLRPAIPAASEDAVVAGDANLASVARLEYEGVVPRRRMLDERACSAQRYLAGHQVERRNANMAGPQFPFVLPSPREGFDGIEMDPVAVERQHGLVRE